MGEPNFGGIGGPVHSSGGIGRDYRLEITVTEKFETHEHDVLVIGAGGAGLRAAIEALAQRASVGVVCKSLLGKAHTVMAEGGIAAAMANVDPADDWRTHFRDTMRGGKMLNNWRMAQLHAQEAPERVRELEQWGALFDRTQDGQILQRAFGGHTFRRLCHVGDRTGLEMIRTLQDRGVQLGIDVYMECTITRLLKDGDRVAGAFGYWREQGRFVVFRAKSIVLATGGIGKAWKITSNSWEYTGDGMALAYDAGAELMDMEFVQFHPTGMVWPPGVQGILVTEAVRGEGGVLRNKDGERFMERYDPERVDLSTRDVVARAIYTEAKEGRGTEHGGAYLDISHKPAEYVKKKLPSMYHQFRELADVDITKGPMEVGPTCHYMMGGIRVDAETAQSSVSGLFAAGEAAAGLHGANRLGGNSLSDLLVFGRRAGVAAAEHAKNIPATAIDSGQIEEAAREMLAPRSAGREFSLRSACLRATGGGGGGRTCEKYTGDGDRFRADRRGGARDAGTEIGWAGILSPICLSSGDGRGWRRQNMRKIYRRRRSIQGRSKRRRARCWHRDRLGGNSLSDLLVFGRRAGVAAAEHAKNIPATAIDSGQIEEAAREMLAP